MGPSSPTQAAFPAVCIWHQPKSYNHFVKKTKPTPAPHSMGTSEKPHGREVIGDPGKPPARLEKERGRGRTQKPGLKRALRWLLPLRAAACPSTHAAGKAATPRLSAHVTGMSTASQLHREVGGISAKTGRH